MKTEKLEGTELPKKVVEKIGTTVDENEYPIDIWKDKYKRVKKIKLPARDGYTHEFIIVRPTQSIMDTMTKNILDVKPGRNIDVFRNSCVMAGDKTVFDKEMDLRNKVIDNIMDLFDNNLEVESKEL